jgi:hypothetical protein
MTPHLSHHPEAALARDRSPDPEAERVLSGAGEDSGVGDRASFAMLGFDTHVAAAGSGESSRGGMKREPRFCRSLCKRLLFYFIKRKIMFFSPCVSKVDFAIGLCPLSNMHIGDNIQEDSSIQQFKGYLLKWQLYKKYIRSYIITFTTSVL